MYCRNCGQEVSNESEFCASCGEQALSYQQHIPPRPARNLFRGIKKYPRITALFAVGVIIVVGALILIAQPWTRPVDTFGPPTNFTITAGNELNTISWEKDQEYDGVVIMYNTSDYAASVDDETWIYCFGNTYIHRNLDPDTTYYYAIWSFKLINGEFEISAAKEVGHGTPYWNGVEDKTIYKFIDTGLGKCSRANGNWAELANNPDATDPTWSQLLDFLLKDQTEREIYTDLFKCVGFAEMLHNNAEQAGIRSAFVEIEFVNKEAGHTCNAFETTDRGLVYIDCTGTRTSDTYKDTEVEISIGSEYMPVELFPEPGKILRSIGEVENYWITW